MSTASGGTDEEITCKIKGGRQRLKHDQRRIIHFKLALGLKKQP